MSTDPAALARHTAGLPTGDAAHPRPIHTARPLSLSRGA